jgi:hypothetical protein
LDNVGVRRFRAKRADRGNGNRNVFKQYHRNMVFRIKRYQL